MMINRSIDFRPEDVEVIAGNGIMTFEDEHAWNPKCQAWINKYLRPVTCLIFDYFVLPLSKAKLFDELVYELQEMISGINSRGIAYGIFHSWGNDLFCYSMKTGSDLMAEEVHLVNAAVEHDFEQNGLNQALRDQRIQRLHIWASERDYTLRFMAGWPRNVLTTWDGFWRRITGKDFEHRKIWFGHLGYIAAKDVRRLNIDPRQRHKVFIHVTNERHSEMWKPENFEATCKRMLVSPPLCNTHYKDKESDVCHSS